MFKYFISYSYVAGRMQYAHADFGNTFVTLNHEITEEDIYQIQRGLNENKFEFRTIIGITQISTK